LEIEPGKHEVLVDDVTLGSGNAPYTTFGDILGWVSLAALVGFMVYQFFVERRSIGLLRI
jgi:apolipoprotein N-acyltransferase